MTRAVARARNVPSLEARDHAARFGQCMLNACVIEATCRAGLTCVAVIAQGAAMSGPLSSLKILDFSTLLPGPFASLLLADMGADVLRVESPSRMDLVRVLPPHDQGVSASH